MFKVLNETILGKAGGKYTLLEMAFMRTHQLNSGVHPTIKTKSKKNAMIALQEIAAGTVRLAGEGNEEDEQSEPAEE